jgi:hypothetical protein
VEGYCTIQVSSRLKIANLKKVVDICFSTRNPSLDFAYKGHINDWVNPKEELSGAKISQDFAMTL